jgi:competence protein ComEC
MERSGLLVSAITRAPMLRVVLPFIAGLVLAHGSALPLAGYWAIAAALGAAGAILWKRHLRFAWRWIPGVCFMLLFFALGGLRGRLASSAGREWHLDHIGPPAAGLEVELTEVSTVKDHYFRAWAVARTALVSGGATKAEGGLLLTLMRDSGQAVPRPGDRLLVRGPLEAIDRVPDPGGFDQRRWAEFHGARHALFAPADQWRLLREGHRVPGFFEAAAARVAHWLREARLPPREAALAKAILLGLRDEMEPDQNQDFVRSGTIHVLAVSGSHVGIIFLALMYVMAWMGKRRWKRLLRGMFILAALWFYAGLTGFSPSVLRATLMFSLFALAETVRWRTAPLNSLAAAAFLLLMWDPGMAWQLGFQLSFLAVLGIVVFYPPLHLLWAPPNAVVGFFWSLLLVSLAAQPFAAPLCLWTFHAFPVWFLPANMVIVGLVGLGVYGAFAVVALHGVPVLGPALSLALSGLLSLLGAATGFFAHLPLAYPAIRVGWWGLCGLYVLLALGSAWVLLGHRLARMGTCCMLLVLLVGWAWTANQRNAQRAFTVYDDREGTMLSCTDGRRLHVFRTAATERLDGKIEAQVRSDGLIQVQVTDSLPTALQAGDLGVRIYAVNRPAGSRAGGGDLLVFHGDGHLASGFIRMLPPAAGSTVVLCGDLSAHARRQLRQWATDQGAGVHDAKADGAYVAKP